MFALDQRSRALCASLALTCFVTAIATTPRAARSATPLPALTHARDHEPAPASILLVPVRRDPFTGVPIFDILNIPAAPGVEFHRMGLLLPPSTRGVRSENALTPEHVSTVVTGTHSYALVTDDTISHVLAPGDSYTGVRIITIALDGLHLADGRVIPITTSGDTTQQ
jgi:hypothetical protein